MLQNWRIMAALVAAVAVFAVFYLVRTVTLQPATVLHVRWLIAHQPVSVFDRAKTAFIDEFNKNSDGAKMEVEILSPEDFSSRPEATVLTGQEVFTALDSGRVDMSTIAVSGLAKTSPRLYALTLPFLFDDYASVEKAMDGATGQKLLAEVSAHTTAHALAFTFSGGFEVIESLTKAVRSASDFKGMRIATGDNPVEEEILKSFGAIPVVYSFGNNDEAPSLQSVDGRVIPYTRISKKGEQPRYISETNHSVFLTSILASNAFFDSLSSENKQALAKAVQAAALVEREDSIALGLERKSQLEQGGAVVVGVSPDTRAALKAASQGVYAQFEKTYGSDLVASLEQR